MGHTNVATLSNKENLWNWR